MKILKNNQGIKISFCVSGTRYNLCPVRFGKWGNPADMDRAQEIANFISSDIKALQFDRTLARYKCQPAAQPSNKDKGDLKWLWERYASYKKPTLAPSTYQKDYLERVGRTLPLLPTTRLKDAPLIAEWVVKNKPTTQAQKILSGLKACCNWALDAQLIDKNPFSGSLGKVKKPRRNPQKGIKPFTASERDRILAAFTGSEYYSHYSYLVRFLFATGCRPSEAIALTWDDVQSDRLTFCRSFINGQVRAGLKTQDEREIRINQTIKSILLDSKTYIALQPALQRNNLVFPSLSGNYIDWHNFTKRAWRKTLKTLPSIIYRNPYQTRHTFITLALQGGVWLPDVATFCGNSSKIIWERYAGFTNDFLMPDF